MRLFQGRQNCKRPISGQCLQHTHAYISIYIYISYVFVAFYSWGSRKITHAIWQIFESGFVYFSYLLTAQRLFQTFQLIKVGSPNLVQTSIILNLVARICVALSPESLFTKRNTNEMFNFLKKKIITLS